MALNDKNLIITPSIGSINDPKIDFVGASTNTGPSTISATIYSTNNGTLSFDGTEGSLFSISNNLSTGSIFSVNPISGIPIIDVNADRTIALNPYGGNTGIGTTSATSKLFVVGDGRFTGVVTATTFIGNFSGSITNASFATTAGIATYATSSGIATYATNAGIATYATNAGVSTYASTAGIATYASSAGIATYATSSGIATYATNSGIATYATTAGVSTSVIGGIASVTQLSVSGISTLGIVTAGNIFSTGIITATSYRGDGSQLTGISASGGISISTNTTNQAQYITYTTGTGSTTGLGVTITGLTFNPSTGNMVVGGTVTANSDESLKTNIKTIDNALQKILSLRGVEYDRIDTFDHQIGLIAQEVEQIIPEVVYPKSPSPDYEKKSIAYANLVAVLIEAIKEQNIRIEKLEERLGGL